MLNIIYIHTHDSGRMTGPYDPVFPTPHLAALAEGGITFRQAFGANPTCSPSRACLLTGTYAHQNGMWGLAHRGFKLNDVNQHMAAWFNEQGYETALFGMQHEAARDEELPYQHMYVAPRINGVYTEQWEADNVDHAAAFLKEKHDRPFFMSVGFFHTHLPWPEHSDKVDPDRLRVLPGIPDTETTRLDFSGYMESVMRADSYIGRVIDAVHEAGLYENTILMFTTDHGVALPGMKCTLTDAGIGVSLILSVPGYRTGRVSDALVSQIDVFPTFCDLIGGERPDWLEGVSLLPILKGEKSVRDSIYAEINYHAARNPQRCVRTKRYKYIRRYENILQNVYVNTDASGTKAVFEENGFFEQQHHAEELFDVMLDPQEKNDLSGNPAYEEILKEMRSLMKDYQTRTGDTIAETGLPYIPGMRVNKVTCRNVSSGDPEEYE